MPTWVNAETFNKLQVPLGAHVYVSALDPEWVQVELPKKQHPELYDYFMTGGELFHRTNQDGELELLAVIDELDPLLVAKARWGFRFAQAEKNRLVFHLIMQDKDDEPPYEMPFIFNFAEMSHRYDAAALCEQPAINLYLLSRRRGRLVVLFSREFEWPDDLRSFMRETVVSAFVPAVKASSPRHEPDAQVDALDLDTAELMADGWSYQFTMGELEEQWGDETPRRMQELMGSYLLEFGTSRNSGIRQGPFLLWVTVKPILDSYNQATMGLIYFVTPFYRERMKGGKTDSDPLRDRVAMWDQFLRSEGGNPIREGAVPVLRYEDGHLTPVRVSTKFLEQAAEVHDDMNRMQRIFAGHLNAPSTTQPNYYRILLDRRGR